MKKLILAITFLCLSIALVISQSSNAAPTDKNEEMKAKATSVSVKAVKAELSAITEEFQTTGAVVAENSVIIRSIVEGPVKYFPWREGQRVQKGDKLCEIERPLYLSEVNVANAAVEVARAKLADLKAGTRREQIAQAAEMVQQRQNSLEFLEKDFQRITALVKSGALPAEMEEKARVAFVKGKTDLASAKEQLVMLKAGPTATEIAVQKSLVAEAEAKAALARSKYEECIIYAPFSGIITRTYVRAGDLATPRAPILDLIDDNSLIIKFAIPENLVTKISLNQIVDVRLDAMPGRLFHGQVKRIFADLDKTTRTLLVEAEITENDEIELLPGMFARVGASLKSEAQALIIPDEALLTTPRGEKIVFAVVNGIAEQRIVKTGIEQEKKIQIIEGIKPGELIVTEGSRGLKDRVAVTIIAAKESEKPTETSDAANGDQK